MPNAILYSGPGVEMEQDVPDGGVVCMRQVAQSAGFTVRTLYRNDRVTADELAGADLWLTPAADEKRGRNGFEGSNSNLAIEKYMRTMGLTTMLRDAISGGLGYVGCCAGAYWAVEDPDLRLAGDSVRVWETKTARKEVIDVDVEGTTQQFTMDLLDGPCFELLRDSGAVIVVGRYETPARARHETNIAMIATQCGRGKVFLSGPHPEAAVSWSHDAGWQDTDANVARNRVFLASRMRLAARS